VETIGEVDSKQPLLCSEGTIRLFESNCALCGDASDYTCLSCGKLVCMRCWNKKQKSCVKCFPHFTDEAYAPFKSRIIN
jgi:hypothetical protein